MQYLTVLAGALLAGSAIAQAPTSSFNSSIVAQVAGEEDAGTKAAWCTGQVTACRILCNQATTANNCTAATLEFQCTCAANNSAPALQYYNPTMISFICNRALGDCLAAHANFQDQQDQCKQDIVCGNSSVQAYANSSAGMAQAGSSSTSSSTASATSGGTSGTTSSTASSTPSKAAAAALEFGATYATGIFGTLLFGIFGLAL